MRRLLPLVLRPTPPPLRLGLVVAAASVAAETVLAYPLERVAHTSSLGVYLLGVVAVCTLWGVRLGAPTAVASVLTWNYFYGMPGAILVHPRDLVALAVFLGVALPAGWVADLARSRALEVEAGRREAEARRQEAEARRQEADLAAELAHLLLRTQDLRSALPAAAQRLARTLELRGAVIELDTVAGDEHHAAVQLHDGATRQGTLLVPADLAEPMQRRLRERIVPSLEALLHVALERQAIGRALETSRDEQRLLAEQQAALRRVATLVAHGVAPTQLFAAVAGEMGKILEAECTEILRYGTGGAYTMVGSWTRSKHTLARPLDSRWQIEPGTVVEVLLRTGRPARIRYRDDDVRRRVWLREHGITSSVGCPIVVEGGQWGAMVAFSTKAEPQPADTEERMQEFTELVATAIANTEGRTQLRLLAEQQAALRRVATLVAHGVAPTQLFAAVAGEMGQILEAECTDIVRYEPDHASFTVVGTWGRSEPTLSGRLGSRWPVRPGLVVEVMLRTGHPARIDRYGDGYHDEVFTWLREHGITSGAGCPIVVEGRQWGAMIAFSTRAEPQPADTEGRMLEFTELVATAIANTESRDELRLLAEQQAALRRVATLVARSVSPTQLFAAVASEMGQILQAECTEVIRYETDRASYTVVGSWTRGKPTLSRPLGSRWPVEIGLVVELLRTERPVRIDFSRDGYGDGEVATWLRENGITSLVACPIMAEGRQWGAMVAQSTQAEPQPAETEERIQEFTELVATAIANTESRTQLRLLADQQAALRRVATLVARGVLPTQVFAAVAGEMGQILEAECTEILRYETDRASCTVVGTWTPGKPTLSRPLGSRWPVDPGLVAAVMLRTGRPARIDFSRDGYGDSDGEVATWHRESGITSAVGCPIVVEGRQWGAMIAFSTKAEPQPADTEERMQEFTELVATAIANTESRTELISSRARVVAAADETRRRIERDLHDGTQQRLISLALELRVAQAATPSELDQLRTQLSHTAQGLAEATRELQEISRGIHPAILSNGGLAPALNTLARRSVVPVELTVNTNQRLAEPIEVAAYYIVSEALTNATKHAHASVVHVNLDVQDTNVRLSVRDDGDGGANPDQGSGLTGLRDRVEALNGTIEVSSPTGDGTSLTVTIPIQNDLRAAHQPAASRHLPHVPYQGTRRRDGQTSVVHSSR